MNDTFRASVDTYLAEEYVPIKIAFRERLAQAAMETCRRRLGFAGIKAFCKCRAKSKESMRAKLEKLWRRGEWETLIDLRSLEYLDFVGVRICLYFLSQAQVVQEILQSEPSFHVVQVRGFGHLDDADSNVSADPNVRSHLGRTGAYDAKHFWVDVHGNHEARSKDELGVAASRVEIQVRSAFMEPWAEIQHDLAYKMVPQGPGEEESRILKDMREASASCEMMAEQLKAVCERRADRRRRRSKM